MRRISAVGIGGGKCVLFEWHRNISNSSSSSPLFTPTAAYRCLWKSVSVSERRKTKQKQLYAITSVNIVSFITNWLWCGCVAMMNQTRQAGIRDTQIHGIDLLHNLSYHPHQSITGPLKPENEFARFDISLSAGWGGQKTDYMS